MSGRGDSVLAALAVEATAVQAVDYAALRERLEANGPARHALTAELEARISWH